MFSPSEGNRVPCLIKTAIARYGLITAVVVAELIFLQDAADVHALRMALRLTFSGQALHQHGHCLPLLLLELSEQFQSLADIRFLLAIGRCEDFHNVCRCNLSISLCLGMLLT